MRADDAGRLCRLVLVRHASAEGEGRFLGHHDAPLSARGRRQLTGLVRRVARHPADAIYASDLLRARDTASAIAVRLRLPVEVRPALREIHFGQWEGRTWEEVRHACPRRARTWATAFPFACTPDGESFARFAARVDRERRRIVGAHAGGCVVIVAHAGVVRVCLGRALGLDDRHLFVIAPEPASVHVIDYYRGAAVVRAVNG